MSEIFQNSKYCTFEQNIIIKKGDVAMEFCELKKVNCIISQDDLNADTLSKKSTVPGLKDCSEKLCEYRGKEGCLLRR